MSAASLHAIVHGRVQGVGFRYFVLQQARALELVGHTRNLADGTVEVYAEGDRAALITLVQELRRGPRAASVTHVETSYGAPQGRASGFHVD